MSASEPPRHASNRRRLPVKPSIENLRKQAKRLSKSQQLRLAQAQHRLAQDYGSKHWVELMHVVEVMNRGADQLSDVQRKVEPLPAAVRARDIATVRAILSTEPFTQHDLDAALGHAAWYGGDAPDVLAVRKELFDLLLDHGADPDGQYGSAYGPIVLGTGECLSPEGLQWLIDAGADVTFPPVDTKYGNVCLLATWLGTYVRGRNDAKHRGIDLLLKNGSFVPYDLHAAVFAIHRGDTAALAGLLDKEPGLIHQCFCHEYGLGNIHLTRSTLLHCAVEFDEIGCIDVLLDHHADINQPAEIIDGVGGQTPIFHLLNTGWASHLATLEHIVRRVGQWIDMDVRATWRTFERPRAKPATPLEYAEEPGNETWRKNKDEEIAMLRSLDQRAEIRRACERGDVLAVAKMLDANPTLLTAELWSPTIHVAKSLALSRLLLERGLNPNISTAPRRALDLACYHALTDIAELLLTHGATATEPNALGERPLDLLDAYEPRPIGDPDTQRIRTALLRAGAMDDIHSAVRAGDLELVRRILDADPTLLKTRDPWPPLFSAARSGRGEIVQLLIERGADVNARNDNGNTPLWFACQSPATAQARIDVAERLIAAGARVRDGCEDDSTALHFAALRGPVAMVELLLRAGAKEWQGDKDGKTALDYARRGVAVDLDQIVELLDRPVIRDPVFKQAVVAIQTGDLAVLQQLLADHPNLSRDRAMEPDCYPPSYFSHPKLLWFVANNPTLIETMPANSVAIAGAIIDAGMKQGLDQADLDYTLGLVMTSSPAREQKLQRPLMKLLLDRGAQANRDDLLAALGHGEREAIEALLESGLPLTAPMAAGLGRTDDLARLLVFANDAEKHAALSMAVINRHVEAARLSLAAGADVNAFVLVHAHSIPAHQAAVNDDVAMLRLLVEHGADLTQRDTLWHGTPLGWAIHTRKPEAEAFLKDK